MEGCVTEGERQNVPSDLACGPGQAIALQDEAILNPVGLPHGALLPSSEVVILHKVSSPSTLAGLPLRSSISVLRKWGNSAPPP